jgi:methyl-accepting chemotaxis protein
MGDGKGIIMFKKFKNMKITNSVLVIVIFSIVSISAVGGFGISVTRKISRNMTDMYNENLIPISKLGDIRTSYLSTRVVINKAIIEYSDEYDAQVQQNNLKIDEFLSVLNGIKLSDDKLKKLKDIESYIDKYIKTWNEVEDRLSKGLDLTDEQYNEFTELGISIEKALEDLSNSNVQEADRVSKNSNAIYIQSLTMQIIIFIVVVSIFTVISLIVVSIIQILIKLMKFQI